MIIQCTKALLDKLEISGDALAPIPDNLEQFPRSIMAWQANYVSIHRKKAIVLMNNASRYPVIIYRPSKKDFANLKQLIRKGIGEALQMEGVRKEIIEGYLSMAGEISFSKTSSRSMLAKLNNTVREVEFMSEYLDHSNTTQRFSSMLVGRLIQLNGPNESYYPYEKIRECLAYLNDIEKSEEILDITQYQLKIKIKLDGFDIWRRVLVPSTYSFRHLHHIIQTVFDWQNYHLHEFVVETKEKPLHIVMNDDAETAEYLDVEMMDIRQERFVSLEDIFTKQDTILYEYDFGDSWVHSITLEKTVKSHSFQAVYLDGNGERPPEDVGGESGFEEYVRIMSDETDPEHGHLKAWAESQKERQLSSEKINKRLQHITSGGGYSTFVF